LQILAHIFVIKRLGAMRAFGKGYPANGKNGYPENVRMLAIVRQNRGIGLPAMTAYD